MTPEQQEALRAFRARRAAETSEKAAPAVNKEALSAWRKNRAEAPMSTAEDMGRSAGSGILKGFSEAADMAQSVTPVGLLQRAADGTSWALNKLAPETFTSKEAPINLTPSIKGAVDKYTNDATQYEPKTKLGAYSKTAGEFTPGLISPGGVVKNAVTNVAIPALATETASQWVKGTSLEKYDPYIRAAAGIASGVAAGTGLDAILNMTKEGAKKSAGKILTSEATDGKKALEAIKEKSLSPLNLAEASKDVGLAQVQKRMAAKSPALQTSLKELEGAQNTARVDELSNLADDAADTLAATKELGKVAKSLPDAIPANPEDIGARVRSSLLGKAEKSKKNIEKLYDAVDDVGDLSVKSTSIRDKANEFIDDLDELDAPLSADESRIIASAAALEDTTSFNRLVKFEKNINSAIAESKTSTGKATEATRRLTQLKSAVRKAIDDGEGLPDGAAKKLRDAAAARREHGDIFETGPVQKILAEEEFKGRFKTGEGKIPSSAFPSGDEGYTTVKAILKADPDAANSLKEAAILKLGSNVTAESLAKWKGDHKNALRAIEEASPGFTSSFDNIASARTEVSTNAAKRLLDAESNDQVRKEVGALLTAKDGAKQITDLLGTVKNDPAAVAGLRKAGMEHMKNAFSNNGALDGNQILSGDKIRKFLDSNSDAVRALYGAEGFKRLQTISDDLKRVQQALTNQKINTGSDTSSQLAKILNSSADKAGDLSMMGVIASTVPNALGNGSLTLAGGAMAGAVGLQLLKAMKRAGANNVEDLLEKSMTNPELARALMEKGISKWGKLDTTKVRDLIRVLNATKSVPGEIAKAHGGAVGGGKSHSKRHEVIANRLVAMAERAKKGLGKSTEALLNAPDDMIAKALEVANRGI